VAPESPARPATDRKLGRDWRVQSTPTVHTAGPSLPRRPFEQNPSPGIIPLRNPRLMVRGSRLDSLRGDRHAFRSRSRRGSLDNSHANLCHWLTVL
jgi:hypothetical protein